MAISPFEDPTYQLDGGVSSPLINPFGFGAPTAPSGGLMGVGDITAAGDRAVQSARQYRQPQVQETDPSLAFNPATQQFFIQGVVLDGDDAQGLLESEQLLGQPPTGLPNTGEWTPIGVEAYQQIISGIRNPTKGRLFSENFASGFQSLKQLGGSALQLAGAEDFGGSIVEGADRQQEKLAPFQREFTDIQLGSDDRGLVDWFVATLGQQGPMLLESVATGLIGAAAGSATAGPGVGTVGGAIAGAFGRKAFRDKVLEAAAKYRAGQVTKDSAEYAILRNASIVTGATAGQLAGSQVIGAGDIYGEMREQGVGADDLGARFAAIAGSFPYAIADTAVEFGVVSRLLRPSSAALPAGASMLRRGGDLLKRGAVGATEFGLKEGATEVFQEGLVMGLSDQDLTSNEAIKRFINSFAAGAAIGGSLGGIANLRARNPDGTPDAQTTEPISLLDNTDVGTDMTRYRAPGSGDIVGDATQAGFQERAETPQDRVFVGELPPGVLGDQGVLDIFGSEGATVGELRERSRVADPMLQLPAPPVEPDPRQGALQFAPPAPEAVTQQPNALQLAMQRAQQVQLIQQRQAEMEAQRQQEMDMLANVAQNQRQLDLAQQAQLAETQVPPLPMVEQQPLNPQQLSLFARGQAPRPSMRERLRRGAPPLETAPAVAPVLAPAGQGLRRGQQMSLFTQTGEPTIAALRSTGVSQPFVPEVALGGSQLPPTGFARRTDTAKLKKAAAKDAAKAKERRDAELRKEAEALNKKSRAEWEDRRDPKAPKWSALSDKQRSDWAKLVSDDKATMAEADRIAGIKPPEPPPKKAKATLKKSETKSETASARPAAPVGETKLKKPVAEAAPTKVVAADEVPQTGLSALVSQVVSPPVEKEKKSGVTSQENIEAIAELEAAIETAESELGRAYTDAVIDIVSVYVTETNQEKKVFKLANEFLFEDGGIPTADFVKALRTIGQTEPSISDKSRLYKLLNDYNLLDDPVIAKKVRQKAEVSEDVVGQEEVLDDITERNAQRLADLINNRDGMPNRNQLAKKASDLYKATEDKDFVVGVRGIIDDYFDKGKPIIIQLPGTNKYVLGTQAESTMSREEFSKREAKARKEMRDLELEFAEEDRAEALRAQFLANDGIISEDESANDGFGNFFRSDEAVSEPMKVGQLRLQVNKFVSKLATKPNVTVFANLDVMRVTNPKLFERAAKARAAGDFEATRAAGMAWGNNVVLFADNINGRKHAEFVIAHEVLGHVGFRGLFSDAQLNKILTDVAKSDAQLTNAANILVENNGIPFTEAVEEVLADRAAAIDTNTITRFWNWMKNQLNKLGFNFDDDAARYLISLSRKYIRDGVGRSEVNLKTLLQEVDTINELARSDAEVLRFAQLAPQGQQTAAMNSMNMNHNLGGGLEGIMDWITSKGEQGQLRQQYEGTKLNVADTLKNASALIRTQDDMARDSKGSSLVFQLTQRKGEMQQKLKTKYARLTQTAHLAKFFGYGKGPEPIERQHAGQLLALGSISRANKLTDAQLQSKYGAVVTYSTELGEVVVNEDVVKQLAAAGTMSVEEFKKGFDVQMGFTEKPMTPEYRKQLETERDAELADHEERKTRDLARIQRKIDAEKDPRKKITLQDIYNNTEDKFEAQLRSIRSSYKKQIDGSTYNAPNMVSSKTMKDFEWVKDLTKDSPEYKMYLEFRNAINESQLDVLRAKYAGAMYEQKRSLDRGINRAFSRPLTEAENALVTAVASEFDRITLAGAEFKENRFKLNEISQADAKYYSETQFARSFYSPDALKDFSKLVPGYTPEEVTKLITSMKAKLKNDIDPDVDKPGESSIWQLSYAFNDRNTFTVSLNDDSLYAKRSIAGGYTELSRRGDFQVRIQAYTLDSNGDEVPVKLRQGQQDSLSFFMTQTRSEALGYAEELNGLLVGDYTMRDANDKTQDVFLKAIVGDTPKGPALVDIMHYDDVMYALNRLGVQLPAPDREVLIKKVTAQNARARSNLERANVPGWDKDVVRSASAFLEKQAYVAANKTFRHQYDSVFEDDKMWFGNPDREAELKAKVEATTGPKKAIYAREYNQERYYNKKARQKVGKTEQLRGQWFRNRALSFVDWQNSTSDVIHADDFWSNNQFSLSARTWAAVTQLGGSIATGVTQVLSLPMNSWVYLSSYNPENNFGVGLGAGRAGYLMSTMAISAANPKYIEVSFIESQLEQLRKSNKEFTADGLTRNELLFLKELTEEQRLDAAQFNALTGTVRGRKMSANPNVQRLIQGWMFPFAYSEQFNRRVTVLATYRGVYENQIAAGITPQEADKAARIAADKAIDATQGDYAQYNRPAFFRGGVMSFVYMYKQYPIIMVQLLKNLDYRGKVMMLGTILLMSGLRGIPFSDDLMDLVDALLQKLRIGSGSLEKDFTRFMREALGAELGAEVTPAVMRGLLDQVTGWSFSNRLGLGDIVPGTALFKPSSSAQELVREIETLAGAPTSFMTGVYRWSTDTVPAVISGRAPLSTLLTQAPVRAIKNAGDAWKFGNNGAILDSKGYVVSPDVTAWELVGKAVGFYPSRAQVQMDWMMADDQEQRYGQIIRSEVVREAVAARMSKDPERLRNTEKFVRDWNDANAGTRLEIKGFNRAVNVAFREATQPLAARKLKSSARAGRQEAEQLAAMYGFNLN